MSAACPTRSMLERFAFGDLPGDEIGLVAEHLDSCSECESTVASFEDQSDTFIRRLHAPVATSRFADDPELQHALAAAGDLAELARGPGRDGDSGELTTEVGQLRGYRLLGKLGEGGMGTVYKAVHQKMNRVVALKVLPAHRRDEASVSRFAREIEAVGKLDHPNIVRAYDAGEEDDMHYLIMELVDGVDLHRLVKESGTLSAADACEVIRQAALGLQHAHEHRLVHRDIKPSNLLLTRDGQVKVLDLGLALLQGQRPQQEELTGMGQVMGTLDYMAPEQASSSHEVDIRADVYALGCTLYKLLSGRAPFADEKCTTPAQKIAAHAQATPTAIKESRDDVPVALSDLLMRMLAKTPEERPATPAEVASAIEPWCDGSDLIALASRCAEVPSQEKNAASADEIPVMLRGLTSHVPSQRAARPATAGHVGRLGRAILDGWCIWLGWLLIGVAVACLLLTTLGMQDAVRDVPSRISGAAANDEVGSSPSMIAAQLGRSLNYMVVGIPAFILGLVVLVVGYLHHGRPSNVLRHACAVALVILLVPAATLAAVVTIPTSYGQLVIETLDEDVRVEVRGKDRVTVVDTSTDDTTLRLRAGKYGLRLEGDAAKYELDSQGVIVSRGERVIVKVKLKPQPPQGSGGSPPSGHDRHDVSPPGEGSGADTTEFARPEPPGGWTWGVPVVVHTHDTPTRKQPDAGPVGFPLGGSLADRPGARRGGPAASPVIATQQDLQTDSPRTEVWRLLGGGQWQRTTIAPKLDSVHVCAMLNVGENVFSSEMQTIVAGRLRNDTRGKLWVGRVDALGRVTGRVVLDAGENTSLDPLSVHPVGHAVALFARRHRAGAAAGELVFLHSADRGETWSQEPAVVGETAATPVPGCSFAGPVISVQFAFILSDSQGRMWLHRTADDGAHWAAEEIHIADSLGASATRLPLAAIPLSDSIGLIYCGTPDAGPPSHETQGRYFFARLPLVAFGEESEAEESTPDVDVEMENVQGQMRATSEQLAAVERMLSDKRGKLSQLETLRLTGVQEELNGRLARLQAQMAFLHERRRRVVSEEGVATWNLEAAAIGEPLAVLEPSLLVKAVVVGDRIVMSYLVVPGDSPQERKQNWGEGLWECRLRVSDDRGRTWRPLPLPDFMPAGTATLNALIASHDRILLAVNVQAKREDGLRHHLVVAEYGPGRPKAGLDIENLTPEFGFQEE